MTEIDIVTEHTLHKYHMTIFGPNHDQVERMYLLLHHYLFIE
jgi:hypothetical protein